MRGERGFATVQWVFMITLAIVLLALIANIVAMQYGAGAMRAAADEGARAGALLDHTTADCERRADDVLHGDHGLLQGSLGDGVSVVCSVDGDVMRATAHGAFEWWVGGFAPVPVTVSGEAILETPP